MRLQRRWVVWFRRGTLLATLALVLAVGGWYWTAREAEQSGTIALNRALYEGRESGAKEVLDSATAELIEGVKGCWSVVQPQRVACYQFQVSIKDSTLQVRCMYEGAPTFEGPYSTNGANLSVQAGSGGVISAMRTWSFVSAGDYLLWSEAGGNGRATRETLVARRKNC